MALFTVKALLKADILRFTRARTQPTLGKDGAKWFLGKKATTNLEENFHL